VKGIKKSTKNECSALQIAYTSDIRSFSKTAKIIIEV